MIGNLNTRQLRNLELGKPPECRARTPEYCYTAHPCGTAHETRAHGFIFDGYSIKETDDKQGRYQLVRWRREVPL